jgi:hypothetical protein
MKKPIPIPTSTAPGSKSQESAGRLINCYAEALGATAANKFVIRRAPGLVNFGTTTQSGCRGFLEVGGVLYIGMSGKLEKLTSAGGASVNVGNMTGTSKGFFVHNNNTTPDKWFVSPDGDIAVFTPTTVTNAWPDADLPAPNSTCVIDGYGVFTIGDGRCFATDLNSTAVNALSFGKAEAKPDGLTRAIAWGDKLLLFGAETTEVWTNAGTSPFPFARNFVIPRGIAGPYCVSGFEDSFSKVPVWVGDDNAVYKYAGSEPFKISPPDLDALIEAVSDKTTLEMCSYTSRGHPLIQLSSATWTWVFDLNTEKWHERDSYLAVRSRITQTIYAFNKWLCGDTATGNVQQILSSAFEEVDSPFRYRIESGPVPDFPYGSVVGRADFNFITGVGQASGSDPDQTDPTVEISWSDDGALTWSAPAQRKLGRQGEPGALISLIAETGRTSWLGRRWRMDISDGVYAGFLYGTQSDDPRAAA